MNVTFAAPGQPKSGVLVIFCPESKKLEGVAADIDKRSGGHVSRAIKAIDFEAKREQILDLVAPEKLSFQRIVIVGLGDPTKLVAREIELLGGAIAGYLQSAKVDTAAIAADIAVENPDAAEFAALLASGAKLRIYSFDHYKSKKPANGKTLQSRPRRHSSPMKPSPKACISPATSSTSRPTSSIRSNSPTG
jgi:leucyl aminopeptidase